MTFITNDADLIVKSPGRINLIGEHIDYNGGHVLPAAIDLKTSLHLRKKKGSNCFISSKEVGSFSFNLQNPIQISKTHWENYVLGVVHGIQKARPNQLAGFDCMISSELPMGAGISSSAALQCGLAKGINALFDLGLSNIELIDIARMAEHHFAGTKCGVMDQFAVMMSKQKKLLLLNCQTLNYKLINADFSPYKIVLLNTNVAHHLASSAYNTRLKECEQALKIIQKKHPQYIFLSEVPTDIIEALKNQLSENVFQRAMYVSRENTRTLNAANLIQKGDVKGFGELMYQTHEDLSTAYEVSCKELDFLVDLTKENTKVVGSRMMGGGFGGCTINLVEESYVNTFIKLAAQDYHTEFNTNLSPLMVSTSDGVEIKKQA